MDEASRFGIMNAKPNGVIYEFEEKPKNPKSNLASMGIYVFSWDKLRKYLIEDENTEGSANDFGKNIIPMMLRDKQKMMAYRFEGYWKDVGTIDSLWDANLDLLNPKTDFDLTDPDWKIYCKTEGLPPQYISDTAEVENSLVTVGCNVSGNLDFSILFSDVTVEEGASVEYSLIMPGAVIKKGAKVRYSIIAENTVVEENAVVGEPPEMVSDISDWGITVVGEGLVIGKNAVVGAKKMLTESVEEGGRA